MDASARLHRLGIRFIPDLYPDGATLSTRSLFGSTHAPEIPPAPMGSSRATTRNNLSFFSIIFNFIAFIAI